RCSFFFSSRRRHTRWPRDWSSDVCSSDLLDPGFLIGIITNGRQPQSGDPKQTAMPAKGGNAGLTDQDVKDLAAYVIQQNHNPGRSEERRVGKECRSGWVPDAEKTRENSMR